MPHFTLQVLDNGPIVKAVFGVSEARGAALAAAGQKLPRGFIAVALVDTGCSCTTVDPMVVTELGLSPTGTAQVITPTTGDVPHQTSQYDVSLMIRATLEETPLMMPTLAVLTAKDLHKAQGIHALIGRDVLSSCLLSYNGTLKLFTLAF